MLCGSASRGTLESSVRCQEVLWSSEFVCWLVVLSRSSWFIENYKSDFHEIRHRCPASPPIFTVNFWEVKVKFQGQHRHTDNLPIVRARPWYLHWIRQSGRYIAGPLEVILTWNDFRWRPGGCLHSLQCESKNPPLRTCDNFSKTVGKFSTKFYMPIMRSYLR